MRHNDGQQQYPLDRLEEPFESLQGQTAFVQDYRIV